MDVSAKTKNRDELSKLYKHFALLFWMRASGAA